MQHGYCDDELSDLQSWLLKTVPPLPINPKL